MARHKNKSLSDLSGQIGFIQKKAKQSERRTMSFYQDNKVDYSISTGNGGGLLKNSRNDHLNIGVKMVVVERSMSPDRII